MIINITLSKQSDPDLLNLYLRLGRKRFMKTIKETLRASIMGKVGRLIYIPSYVPPMEENSVQIIVFLTSKKDEIIREYLEPMSSKSRTGYIKTILRLNLGLSFIRDEFFGIDSSQIEAKPLAYIATQPRTPPIKRPPSFAPKPQQNEVPKADETIPIIPSTPVVKEPIKTPEPLVQKTQEDDDDLFSMLTNLIDD